MASLDENQKSLSELRNDAQAAFDDVAAHAQELRERLNALDAEVSRSGATMPMADDLANARRMIDALVRTVSQAPSATPMMAAGIKATVTGQRGP